MVLVSCALIPAVSVNTSDPPQLSEILSFGMDKLLSSEESSVHDINLEKILGPSRDGRWVDEALTTSRREPEEEEEPSSSGQSVLCWFLVSILFPIPSCLKDSLCLLFMLVSLLSDHLYYFEGKDYSKVPSAADQMYFQQLMKEHVAELLGAAGSRTLRQKTIVSVLLILSH